MAKYSFFIIILCLSACATQKEQVEVNREAVISNIISEHDKSLQEINFKQQRLYIKDYADGNWMNSDCNPQKYYSEYQELGQWREIDKELMRIYNTYKDKDYFHAVGQNIAGRFLRQKLFLLDQDEEVVSRVAFYLDMLISNESPEWEIITESVAILESAQSKNVGKKSEYAAVIQASEAYILDKAPQQIELLEGILVKLENQYQAREKAQNIKIDRNQATLFNLKKVELEEAKEAIALAQK